MRIVFSKHALDRLKGREVEQAQLEKLILTLPAFKGVIDWKFPNGYYVVLSQQNNTIIVITVGKNVRGRFVKNYCGDRPSRKQRW